jgi:uncharacterized protein involved in exopolysaccharide biosynthesis
MKAQSTASAAAEERKGRHAETGLHPAGTDGYKPKNTFTPGSAIEVLLENLKLLLLGPFVVALVTFGIVSLWPKSYTSVAYLALDETGARVADARMRSSPVLDKVLTGYKAPKATLEARRRYIEDNRRIIVAAGESQKTSNLFRLEYTDGDPATAQKVNSLFIEAWLESTRPAPDKRDAIEAEIERADTQSKSISKLIERLEKDAPSLIAQSLQGELATPILGLIAKRDQNLATLITLRNSLSGVSRDVIFGTPDLPEEPSWPRRGIITILAAFAAALLLLAFVILRRFVVAPSRRGS